MIFEFDSRNARLLENPNLYDGVIHVSLNVLHQIPRVLSYGQACRFEGVADTVL